MKRSPLRNARLALFAFLLLVFAALESATAADAVMFPPGKPAFSVIFPETWTAQVEENGTLTARPNDNPAVRLTVLTLEGVGSEKAASAALVRVSESVARATEVAGLKLGEIAAYRTEKNLRCLHMESKGRDRGGGEIVLTTIAFALEPGRYFVLITSASPAAEKAHESELVGIVQSIDGED